MKRKAQLKKSIFSQTGHSYILDEDDGGVDVSFEVPNSSTGGPNLKVINSKPVVMK